MPDIALSVIIPVLNEAGTLARTLAPLRQAVRDGWAEVLVVDGGSEDGLADAYAHDADIRLLTAPRGRAAQMTAVADHAVGAMMLFLHADTRLPDSWRDDISSTLTDGASLGAFTFKLDSPDFAARMIEAGVRIRNRLFALPYGDQALFMSRDHYRALDGFAGIPLMEDVDFVRRSKRLGRVAVIRSCALTSARKWKREGYIRRTARNVRTLLRYLCGVSVDDLARSYDPEQ